VDEVLEDDERAIGIVVDPGHAHHGRLWSRREAARSREETLLTDRVHITQELEADHLIGRFVERPPDLGVVVPAVEGRKAIARGDELPRLRAGDRSVGDGV
jgi:hypothetical protein